MTGTVGTIFGLLVIIVTVILLVKQYDTRTVLLSAGFIMAIAAFAPLKAFSAFSTNMVAAGLIQNICTTLGFAAVLKITGCDKHLIHAMAGALSKVKPLLIPGALVATFVANIALPSASGVSAAIGVILIPLLISQGVNPAMAATSVIGGTFGALLNPGGMHHTIVANIAGITAIEVVKLLAPIALISFAINTTCLTVIAYIFKENKGYEGAADVKTEHIKINPFYAVLPMVPVLLLLITSTDTVKSVAPWTTQIAVPHVMLFGSFLCIIATRTSLTSAVKEFFSGMGKGYADIIGIIISAGVFVSGIRALGIVDSFIELLKSSTSLVGIAAAYGPLILGAISGSGDAATLAFNDAVTPHAASFGYTVTDIGTLVMLSGSFGRLISPLAGATIICAGIAKVNPFEVSKRNAVGMVLAATACMIIIL